MTTKVLAPEIYAISCACTRGWMKPSSTWWTSWLKHHTCCNRLSWMAALWGRRRRSGYCIQDPSRSKHYHDRRQFISLNNTNNGLKNYCQVIFPKRIKKKDSCMFCWVLMDAKQNGHLMLIKYSCEHYVFITEVGDHKIKYKWRECFQLNCWLSKGTAFVTEENEVIMANEHGFNFICCI